LPQLNPSSSCEDIGLLRVLLLGVFARETRLSRLLPLLLLSLPLLSLLGGVSGTFGCAAVSVSGSVACTVTSLLRLLLEPRYGRLLLLGSDKLATRWKRPVVELNLLLAARMLLPADGSIAWAMAVQVAVYQQSMAAAEPIASAIRMYNERREWVSSVA
jgi:hypothetical protein